MRARQKPTRAQRNQRSGHRTRLLAGSLVAMLAVLAAAACADSPGTSTPAPDDRPGAVTAFETPSEVLLDEHGEPLGLHHHRRWTHRLGQGAQPGGEVAFQNLSALGYTTVLSVDGARPDLENAAKHGLRYVHIPIGYHGVEAEQAARITKAVESSDGPVYVHCHHGLHRGPTATMIARIALEGISNDEAVAAMKLSGTSAKYTGLYADVQAFVPDREAVAAVPADLPSYVAPAGLVDAMVHVDERFSNLQDSREAKWTVPAQNPDVDPPHEARMIWEHFREIARTDEAKKLGDAFAAHLSRSETAAKSLEDALRRSDSVASEAAYTDVKAGCKSCHDDFRNKRQW